MDMPRANFLRRLFLWRLSDCTRHFVVVLLHLWVAVQIQPSFSRSAIPG
jgi:hypothetical protein